MAQTKPERPERPLNGTSRGRRHSNPLVPLVAVVICGALSCATNVGYAYLPAIVAVAEDPQKPQPGNPTQQPTKQEPDADSVVRGEYSAVSQSLDEGRIENIKLASDTLNGTTIAPGETFSFNAVVGNTATDERYKYAPVISGFELDSGRGGGICQVSSAVYVAALYANLKIEERHPHTVVQDYVTAGLDATVSFDDTMDLQVRNNTNASITISAEASGQSVIVKIFGEPFPEGVTVGTTTELVGYNWQHNDELDRDELYCKIRAYRVFFQNGEKTDGDEWLSEDRYLDPLSNGVSLPDGGAGVLQYTPPTGGK